VLSTVAPVGNSEFTTTFPGFVQILENSKNIRSLVTNRNSSIEFQRVLKKASKRSASASLATDNSRDSRESRDP
jgi:hypothetical protein